MTNDARLAPSRSRLVSAASLLFVGVVPAALIGIGIFHFILNHFFSHAPYLLDSGWYSDIVYRAGVFPRNPRIACDYAEWYFGVHFSPLITLFSLLSYLVPIDRIEWYALFQALIFIPFGFATYVVASRVEPERALQRLPITFVAALAFTFNGQIVRTIGYPHYEVATASFICVLLGMLLTGRMRLAWLFFVLAILVREDAGVHTALALVPLWYLRRKGVDMAPSRRTLLFMIGVAFGSTIFGVFCQKVLFHGASVMSEVYLGKPIGSHLSWSVIVIRAKDFVDRCSVMYFPFFATCIIAVIRRDWRYLLGWIAGVPWLMLNFLAAQPQKASFEAYTGFPFVVSIFWVYAYGAMLAPRRARPTVLEAAFAIVCLTATVGLYRSLPQQQRVTFKELATTRPIHRDTVHSFVRALGEGRTELGRFYVDYSVASVALESVTAENSWRAGITAADTIAFHNESAYRDWIIPDLFANGLDTCTHIVGTGFYVCTAGPLPATTFASIPTEVMPSIFAFAFKINRRTRPKEIAVDSRGVVLRGDASIDGRLGLLPKGSYELKCSVDSEGKPPGETLAVNVTVGTTPRASTTLPKGARELSLIFETNGEEIPWFRMTARGPGTLTLMHAQVRRIP